jgi:hypothetical protein
MPNWKKVIVSGSNAVLNHITSSGHMSVLGGGLTVNTHTSTELEVVGDISASGGTITGNNITAANQLETKYRKLNLTSTTYDYSGDVVFFGTEGTNFSQGELVYYNRDNGTWNRADFATGTVVGTSLLGIALGDTPTSGFLIRGFITTDHFSNPGSEDALYMGALGDMQNTPPTSTGAISRIVGHLLSPADSSPFEIYFNPSPDWIEIEA